MKWTLNVWCFQIQAAWNMRRSRNLKMQWELPWFSLRWPVVKNSVCFPGCWQLKTRSTTSIRVFGQLSLESRLRLHLKGLRLHKRCWYVWKSRLYLRLRYSVFYFFILTCLWDLWLLFIYCVWTVITKFDFFFLSFFSINQCILCTVYGPTNFTF